MSQQTSSRSLLGRVLVAAAVVSVAALVLSQGWHRHLTIEQLQEKRAELTAHAEERPLTAGATFSIVYFLVAALQIPGAAVLTVAAGTVFGLLTGVVLVSIGSTLGATAAMLVSRYVLRDWVRRRFHRRMEPIESGVERDGAFYLFTLRLIPIFPFWLINLAMGLTGMRTWTFTWVSQIGMLPGTAVYVFAGTRLARIDSLSALLSPELVGAFALIGLFPWLTRWILGWIRSRRAFAGHRRPSSYDYDLVVIGAGSAGLVAANIGATARARVALVEKDRMGGDCLNTGCVPSKALIRTASIVHQAREARRWGVGGTEPEVDLRRIMDRVRETIATIAPHDSVERYTRLGVDCLKGKAHIESPFRVRVGERVLTTRAIVVASGAAPFVPPIPGIGDVSYLTSDTLWELDELPERLTVLGGGPIGCELGQAFARLGSRVTIVEMLPRILSREDPDVSALLEERLRAEGVDIRTGHRATRFAVENGRSVLYCERVDTEDDAGGGEASEPVSIEHDQVLIAIGRKARVEGFGLEELGVRIAENGTVARDGFLRTDVPNIFVCGDVAGPYQFTHTASHQAWHAAINALASPLWASRVDERVIPWVTYTDPEIARVGLDRSGALDRGLEEGRDFEVTRYDLAELDRAITEGKREGFVAVLTEPRSDRILGATVIGAHAGEILAELVLAMKHGLGLKKILGTIHPYPTLAEANRNLAGQWQRAHTPDWLLRWAERFFRWRRR